MNCIILLSTFIKNGSLQCVLILILCINHSVRCQNLVPNFSFEKTKDTISGFTNSNIEFEEKIFNWVVPNTGTPDLITPDFEEHFISPSSARTGLNMIGLGCSKHRFKDQYWGEYVGVKLIDSLSPQKTYHIEYYIRRADCIATSIDKDEFLNSNFGILFTYDPISLNSPDVIKGIPNLPGNPKVLITNKKWLRISAYFTPTEPYNYLYIGHFHRREDLTQSIMYGYYMIDDISVVAISDFEELDNNTSLYFGNKIPLKNLNFISGTTKLSNAKSKTTLDKLAKYLYDNQSMRIRINGHTDSIGDEKANKELSQNRAKTIAEILIQKGIDKDRIEWEGFGEELPISDNNSEESRSKNRRVEFEVIE